VEQTKQVSDKENDQYRPQAYASSAAGTPTGVPVVSSTEAEKQYQNDDE
jgi:hypothetical protein